MLKARPRKWATYAGVRIRMYPAWQTRSTRRSSRAEMMAFSWASRLGYCLGSRKSASMPWTRAMSRAGAVSRSEMSTTMVAGIRPACAASTRARKFEPRPEARTPTRSGSGIHDRPRAGPDLAHLEDALSRSLERPPGAVDFARAYHEEIADAHVEGAAHLGVLHLSARLDDLEDGRHRPRPRVDDGLAAFGEDAREILGDAAARHVGHGEDGHAAQELEDGLDVDARRLEELVGHRATEARHHVVRPQLEPLEDHLADQREAVGVQSAGRQPEHAVARANLGPGDQAAPLDHTHREAREVVLARSIERAHLGRLPAHECAARLLASLRHAPHDGLDAIRLHAMHGEVVEEVERLRPVDEQVVDSHRDEVDTHRVVAVGGEGDMQLGPHSVGGGDEDGLAVTLRDGDEGREGADPAQDLGPAG